MTALLKASIVAVLATSALGMTMVPSPEWLEYGALGLCGLMILCNFWERKTLVEELHRERERAEVLSKATIGTLNRFCRVMESRPCLHGDSVLSEVGREQEGLSGPET